jgi:hypothetical protein
MISLATGCSADSTDKRRFVQRLDPGRHHAGCVPRSAPPRIREPLAPAAPAHGHLCAFPPETPRHPSVARSRLRRRASNRPSEATRRTDQSSDGGGPRAPSGSSSSSSPRCLTCARIRSISAGSSMLAITVSRPPQRRQRSISIANTRFKRCIQLIATCFGVTRSTAAPAFPPPCPRPAGVIAARNAACGANTPWYLVRCTRGGGTNAARRARKSSGSNTTCVVTTLSTQRAAVRLARSP